MDQILNLPLSKKILLFLGLSLLIDGGAYMLLVNDAQGNVDGLRRRLGTQRHALEKIKKEYTEDKLVALERETSELRKKISDNEKLLPTKDELAEFILRIKNHADISGLTVVRFSKRDKVYEEKYSMIPIRMEAYGTTVQLVKFFRTLADPKERLVNIRRLEVNWLTSFGKAVRPQAMNDADLAEVHRMASQADLRKLDSSLAERLDRLVTLDRQARVGRVKATFTVNAFTFLTPEERVRANKRGRR
jgi:Tfp pilus assembly protein PilO